MYSILRIAAKITILFVLLFLILGYAPGLLNINPISVRIKPCPPFEGPLTVNNRLKSVERLFEDELDGPESIAAYENDLCMGLADGRIICVEDGKINIITQIGNPLCEGKWEEDICGRPLGMRFDKKGILYVADAYYGIYKINIKSGSKRALYINNFPIDGRESFVINDLDISKNGDVYFSDSSSWPLKVGIYGFMEMKPKGRILHFNPKTNETTSIIGGINFANGIQLSPDEECLLISETGFNRILKYYLKGPKKGYLEVFADNLPGYPDNIRLNPRGGYWVGQCGTRIPGQITLAEILGDKPFVRRILARALHALQSILGFIKTCLPVPVFVKELHYKLAHLHPYISQASPMHGLVIELNQNGEIIQSLHDPSGSVRFISEVLEYKDDLYFGSPWHNFLGRLKLNNT